MRDQALLILFLNPPCLSLHSSWLPLLYCSPYSLMIRTHPLSPTTGLKLCNIMRWIIALLLVASCNGFIPGPHIKQQGQVNGRRRSASITMGIKNVRFGDAGLDKLVEGINVVGNSVRVSNNNVIHGAHVVSHHPSSFWKRLLVVTPSALLFKYLFKGNTRTSWT